jgi:hypothetical protein
MRVSVYDGKKSACALAAFRDRTISHRAQAVVRGSARVISPNPKIYRATCVRLQQRQETEIKQLQVIDYLES